MAQQKNPTPKSESARPPYLRFMVGLVLAATLALGLGYATWQQNGVAGDSFTSIEKMWDDRLRDSNLADQEINTARLNEDKDALSELRGHFKTNLGLMSVALAGLLGMVLVAYLAYEIALISPLRKLVKSCQDIVANNLKGHVWGIDREDLYGALARAIDGIRNGVVKLSDMVVKTPDGEQHIEFGGRSGAMFNTLIADMQDALAQLQAQNRKLEEEAVRKQETLAALDENALKSSASLEAALDASRMQLAGLQDEWVKRFATLNSEHAQVQEQAKNLVTAFTQDLSSMRQIATATGQRVSQMLQNLGATDQEYRKAAKLSLETSESFSKHASDISEKLNAATGLLRASGKVMSETTENARTRLNEAINSVSRHDEALQAFLKETADKSGQVTTLFGDMKMNAGRIADVVAQFDARMNSFESRSDAAFMRIAASSETMESVSGKLNTAHDVLNNSMQAMHGHTDMLAKMLTTIRDEYRSFMGEWQASFSEAAPAIGLLKDASQKLQNQITDEWERYTIQSRQILSALEKDVVATNLRTQQLVNDADRMIAGFGTQSQRINDSANNFDLQLANLSQRIENAAGTVLVSNENVVRQTTGQVNEIHEAVQDMVQRLSILSQLTGTLGAVAGQLGQIVPALGETRHMHAIGTQMTAAHSADPVIAARFERIGTEFSTTITEVREEFNSVRGQITKWVDMLTNGYQRLAGQISMLDGNIEEKILKLREEIRPVDTTEKILPAITRIVQQSATDGQIAAQKVIADMQALQENLNGVRGGIGQTAGILQNMSAMISEGFTRLEHSSQPAAEPVVKVDTARIDNASRAMEAIMRSMQAQSSTLVEKLGQVTQALTTTSNQLHTHISEASQKILMATPQAPETHGSSLDQAETQIAFVASMLDRCAAQSESWLAEAQTPEQRKKALEKSRAIAESIMSAISRLHVIGESVERVADHATNNDQKTG